MRKFAEESWSIHLDNKQINIYDSETNETFISGVYDSPYWIIEFNLNGRKYTKNRLRQLERVPRANLVINSVVVEGQTELQETKDPNTQDTNTNPDIELAKVTKKGNTEETTIEITVANPVISHDERQT